MNVRWTAADDCLISAGGGDKCIMQWRHLMTDMNGTSGNASGTGFEAEEGQVGSIAIDEDTDHHTFTPPAPPKCGDEAGAVKPWIGAIRAPPVLPPNNTAPPNVQLDLKWVHGYTGCAVGGGRGKSTCMMSNNVYYNPEGSPI